MLKLTQFNQGPKIISQQGFSVCHWNLNSIFVHNFAKIFLLKAYEAIHKFDTICSSETYLDSSIPINNDNLDIDGYNLVDSDHPSNTKHGRFVSIIETFFFLYQTGLHIFKYNKITLKN